MANKPEKDEISGTETTGHEWGGIKELNTPLPRWWVWTFIVTVIWCIYYWIIMPAWPLLSSYTEGTQGYSSRAEVNAEIDAALEAQSEFLTAINAMSLEDIQNDPELSAFAFASGRSAFGLHCSQCHGLGGQGAYGIPSLTDDDWIWGGDLENIYQTIRAGVRDTHPDSRFNMMPAYLNDGLLNEAQVQDVAAFVANLGETSDFSSGAGLIYSEQCSACHGPAGGGIQDLGGPNLVDAIWLYGGSEEDIYLQIANPQHGMMPAWESRLSPETLKKLAIYVHSLGGGE
jgi:cytochrome c oxidase cbb3-type subunit 3